MTTTGNKLPPSAIEAEEAVLGACFIEEDASRVAVGILKPDMFFVPNNQHIFASIYEMSHKGKPVDIITVTSDLRQKGILEEVGGAIYVTELSSMVVTTHNVESYCFIIREKSILRQHIAFAANLTEKAYTDNVLSVNEFAENEVFKISSQAQTKEPKRVDSCVDDLLVSVSKVVNNPGILVGIPSGLSSIDRITGGFQNSDLIIVAGRPSQGKSACMLTLATGAARLGTPVAIFSLEMSTEQLTARMVSGVSGYTNMEIRNGKVNMDTLVTQSEIIAKLPVYIDDTAQISIAELRSKTKKLILTKGVKMIFVDYLQLMRGLGDSREQEVASISRGLKALAKEMNIPVIALAQLNREVESTSDKRPQLSHLRGSGEIEQDADIVAFIYRPKSYRIDSMKINGEEMNTNSLILFDIQKHRNGALYPVCLYHNESLTQIVDDRESIGIPLF